MKIIALIKATYLSKDLMLMQNLYSLLNEAR